MSIRHDVDWFSSLMELGSRMIVSVPLNLCCLASLLASDLLRIGLPLRAAIASLISSSEEGMREEARCLPVHQ